MTKTLRHAESRLGVNVHAMFLLHRPPTALISDFLKVAAAVLETP